MAKDAYYFSHDANARNDEKILMLMADHGWEGYGIFWGLLEMMFENEETSLKHKNLKGIAVRYNIDITVLSSVIDTAIAEQLFVSDGVSFWSESLRLRKKEFHKSREQKSLAGKKGMEKRWGKKNKSVENTNLDNGVITEDNSVITNEGSDITENNKVKESKEKKSKKNNIYIAEVDDVWNYYCEKLKALGKTRRKTDNKTKHINARLEEKFSVEQLKQVIDNVFSNDFMLGENEQKKMYIEIDNFMCNTEKVEKWIESKQKQEAHKPTEEDKCPFCRGKGVVPDPIEKWKNCPKCNGAGKNIKEVEKIG